MTMLRRNHANRNKGRRLEREQKAVIYGVPYDQGSPGVLKLMRLAANVSTEDAGKEFELSAVAWERLEAGMTPISPSLMEQFCHKHGFNADLLNARLYSELGTIQQKHVAMRYVDDPPYDQFLYILDDSGNLYARKSIKDDTL